MASGRVWHYFVGQPEYDPLPGAPQIATAIVPSGTDSHTVTVTLQKNPQFQSNDFRYERYEAPNQPPANYGAGVTLTMPCNEAQVLVGLGFATYAAPV
jgi:hypothetical protein